MRRFVLSFVLGLGVLAGCTHQYTMKLNNGRVITTASKPKLKDGSYHFKDAKGNEHVLSQGVVREVLPSSMAQEEDKFTPVQPYKKHWYWPF